ncbi:hypothetical protein SAMN05444955_10423 [Lihuaxuella thermophila]|uniref:Uncharacterized protein n=1 Tax=Lihuaxuella thermophila TaxID=1173111 RepID=A0A1H8CMP8_9BACL|nr:hypothetical protein SAMN05444955_10423 [Lihuaxuella thermophila]
MLICLYNMNKTKKWIQWMESLRVDLDAREQDA